MRWQRFIGIGLLIVGPLATVALPAAAQTVLHRERSAYNTIIVTEEPDGLRTLWFDDDGARQSVVKLGDPDHLALPYARTMLAGMALVKEPKRILVVGLGGGTIPSFLHKHYPEAAIDVVELDPAVVRVAKRFFGFAEDALLRVHVADGRKYIEQCRKQYDVVFLDAFGAENIPYHLTTREFLQAVRRLLSRQGLVLGNIWSREANPLHDEMIRTYQAVFDELLIVYSSGAGNEILVALPRSRRITRKEFVQLAAHTAKRWHCRYDLAGIVARGYYHPAPDEFSHARILTDEVP